MRNINFEKLKHVLPEIPGILRKKEYFNSAVLIPLVLYNEEHHFFLKEEGQK